jgi:hypothetical protein
MILIFLILTLDFIILAVKIKLVYLLILIQLHLLNHMCLINQHFFI